MPRFAGARTRGSIRRLGSVQALHSRATGFARSDVELFATERRFSTLEVLALEILARRDTLAVAGRTAAAFEIPLHRDRVVAEYLIDPEADAPPTASTRRQTPWGRSRRSTGTRAVLLASEL